MPNQPKTPARTFRLSDEHIEMLRKATSSTQTMTDSMRNAIEEFSKLSALIPAPASIEELARDVRATLGQDECDLHAVMEESELPENSQIMLNGATRFMDRLLDYDEAELFAEVRRLERERTIREVLGRLGGMADLPTQYAIDHLKSIVD